MTEPGDGAKSSRGIGASRLCEGWLCEGSRRGAPGSRATTDLSGVVMFSSCASAMFFCNGRVGAHFFCSLPLFCSPILDISLLFFREAVWGHSATSATTLPRGTAPRFNRLPATRPDIWTDRRSESNLGRFAPSRMWLSGRSRGRSRILACGNCNTALA